MVDGGEIPYKPEALAKKQQNVANRMKVDVAEDLTWHDVGDPELKCYMPGSWRECHGTRRSYRCLSEDNFDVVHLLTGARRREANGETVKEPPARPEGRANEN